MTVETTQGTVTVTIDGFEIRVPKGTLVIRAAEQVGIQIPRFCDHPLLDPVGACRQCLVEVGGQRKPAARSEEHTSELQSHSDLVCRLLLEKKKKKIEQNHTRM